MIQTKSKTVVLYVVEEQEIYKEIYSYTVPKQANNEVIRVSGNDEKGAMLPAVAELPPNMMLSSVKKLDTNIIEELQKIRNSSPRRGKVILIVFPALKTSSYYAG